MRLVARKILAEVEKGWCQGEGEDADGNICLGEAMNRGVKGDKIERDVSLTEIEATTRFYRWFLNSYPGYSTIPGWNDERERTQADVIELCKSYIAYEDEQFFENGPQG